MAYWLVQRGKIELRYRGDVGKNAAFARTEVVAASNAWDVICFENEDVHYVLNFQCAARRHGSYSKWPFARTYGVRKRMGILNSDPAGPSPFILDKPTGSYFDLQESWGR
jgi:hypothetical protein